TLLKLARHLPALSSFWRVPSSVVTTEGGRATLRDIPVAGEGGRPTAAVRRAAIHVGAASRTDAGGEPRRAPGSSASPARGIPRPQARVPVPGESARRAARWHRDRGTGR